VCVEGGGGVGGANDGSLVRYSFAMTMKFAIWVDRPTWPVWWYLRWTWWWVVGGTGVKRVGGMGEPCVQDRKL
jgi:hypothetical protein